MKKYIKFLSASLVVALLTALIPSTTAFAEDTPLLISAPILIAPAPNPVKTVSLAPQYATSAASSLTALTLKLGGSGYDLKYYGVSDYKTQLKNGTLLWVSSDSTVASVNQSGLVTPVSEGICEISLQVGTGEYSCVPVVVTVIDPSKPVVSPTPEAVPSVAPTSAPEVSKAPETSDTTFKSDTVVFSNDRSPYKPYLEVVDTLNYSGFCPTTEEGWTDVITTLFRIKIYDPCTEKDYTIDKDNPIPANWSVKAVRYHNSSALLKSIGVMVPYNTSFTYLELPVEMLINFR